MLISGRKNERHTQTSRPVAEVRQRNRQQYHCVLFAETVWAMPNANIFIVATGTRSHPVQIGIRVRVAFRTSSS